MREQREVCVALKTCRPSYQLGKYYLQRGKMHIGCVNPLLLQFGEKKTFSSELTRSTKCRQAAAFAEINSASLVLLTLSSS